MDIKEKLKELRVYKNNYLHHIVIWLFEGYEVRVTLQKNKKYSCYKSKTLNVLEKLGVNKSDIIIDNDAPRGGQLGNLISIDIISINRKKVIHEILS